MAVELDLKAAHHMFGLNYIIFRFLLLTLKSTKGYLNLFHQRVLGCIASARSASAALLLPLVEL